MPSEPLPPFGAITMPPLPKQRNRKLKRAFFISLPIMILLFLTGSALLVLQLSTWMGLRSYSAGEAQESEQTYSWQTTLRFLAPWVADYNLGTSVLSQGRAEEAVYWLEKAFESVPKATPGPEGQIQAFTYECTVRFNTSAAYEVMGDGLRAVGDTAGADGHYATAQEWLEPCAVGGGGGGSDDSEGEGQGSGEGQGGGEEGAGEQEGEGTASDRLDQKRRELQGDQPDEGQQPEDEGEDGREGTEPSDDPFEGESEAERERREQLQGQKNEQAEREREREESANRDFTPKGW